MKYIYLFTLSLLFITCKNGGNTANTSSSATSQPTAKAAANMLDQVLEDKVVFLDGSQKEIPYWHDKDAVIMFLVRHAEKEDDSKDPDLTAAGRERATKLSVVTRNADIDNVYQSGMKRTFQTAFPSLKAIAIPGEMYDTGKLTSFVDEVVKKDLGKKVLIVGHSNTTPAIMNHLLGKMVYKNIPHEEYGNIYIVSTKGIGNTKVMEVKY